MRALAHYSLSLFHNLYFGAPTEWEFTPPFIIFIENGQDRLCLIALTLSEVTYCILTLNSFLSDEAGFRNIGRIWDIYKII